MATEKTLTIEDLTLVENLEGLYQRYLIQLYYQQVVHSQFPIKGTERQQWYPSDVASA